VQNQKAVAAPALTSKTARAIGAFALTLTAGSVLYGLYGHLLPQDNGEQEPNTGSLADVARSMLDPGSGGHASALPMPATAVPNSSQEATEGQEGKEGPHEIEDATGHALSAFHRALAELETGHDRRAVRVIHYGDSMLTADTISSTTRRLLQERFGDGGHGYILPGRPWSWYSHVGVNCYDTKGWRINRVTNNPLPDGRFGLGAVAFRSHQPGARSIFELGEGVWAEKVEVFFERQPQGGTIAISTDGRQVASIDTAGPEAQDAFEEVAIASESRRVVVENMGGGPIRIFGIALEKSRRGVVYDGLGVNGLHANNFERFDGEHLAAQIRHRSPDLIITTLGTNESQIRGLDLERHRESYVAMMLAIRRGAPDASCLVMSPPDRAFQNAGGRPAAWRIIPGIVEAQRRAATESGCAFFSTFDAMGGQGSAARWRRQHPALMGGDLTHPTEAGSERIGTMLFQGLMASYEARERP